MLFNSYVFIFAFLPVVFAVYCFVRRYPERRWTIGWLALASLFYYAWWKPEFLLLLLGSIAVNAWFGNLLCSMRLSVRAAKTVLILGVLFNLGLLGYFKYAGFFVTNLNSAFGAGFSVPQIILPIGISFYTFQQIAFLVDAHRGAVRHFSLLNYALFVTFFPQLIAGPIVHHGEMMPQFTQRTLPGDRSTDFAVGLSIFCVGLFKKVVIADACAVYADAGYGMLKAGQPLDFASAWITVLAFSFQLYYDFSGYSDMAVGLARLFGIHLPVNFHSPYRATGIIDFWRRWHITLSRFLKDYLYIPLGGNQHGAPRQYINLALVMLLGGFWHGANWTFIVWGAIHGALLGVNHAWTQFRISRLPFLQTTAVRGLFVLMTFLVVTLAWVPFRADNLAMARRMLGTLLPWRAGLDGPWQSIKQMVGAQLAGGRGAFDLMTWFKPRELWPPLPPPDFVATYRPGMLLLLGVMLVTFLLPNTNQIFARFNPVMGLSDDQLHHRFSLRSLDWRVAFVISGMFVFSVLQLSRVSPFLYFQF